MLVRPIVKQRTLEELTREAQESTERARELRARLAQATANVDGMVVEARTVLRRAVDFLERERMRGTKSGLYRRIDDEMLTRLKLPDDAEPL